MHKTHSLRNMEACDIIWMDCPRICSGNSLEVFEVLDVRIEPNGDSMDDELLKKRLDFLFPSPKAKTTVHHFSRLKCLKLCRLRIRKWDENISLESLGIDEKRMQISFPELLGLVLYRPTGVLSRSLAKSLLRIRAPYIESLHLAHVSLKRGMEDLSFPNLYELCLAEREEVTMAWLDYFAGKAASLDKTKTRNPWHLDKLCVEFGDVRKWKAHGKLHSIAKAVEMTLYPTRKGAFKCISFQFEIPLGWRNGEKITDNYLTQVMEQIITGLRGIISKGAKLDGHFSIYLNCIFQCYLRESHDSPQGIEEIRLLSSEIGKELCDSRLLYWINEMSDKVVFEISIRNRKIDPGAVARSLSTWESKYHQLYSMRKRLRRNQFNRLNLRMTSKNWSRAHWKVSCPRCKYVWDSESYVAGNDAWARFL